MSSFEALSEQHAGLLPCWEQLQELRERFQEEVLRGLEKDRMLLQQDKLASVGQLAAGVAHEINNPMGFISCNLNSLKGYAEALTQYIQVLEVVVDQSCPIEQKNCVMDLKHKLDIDFISSDINGLIRESIEGSRRVTQIVLDLKDFANIDESTVLETDLNMCISRAVSVLRSVFKNCGLPRLLLGELPLIFCNPQQMHQVVSNLLVNAAQAVASGGEITVSSWCEDEYVLFSVEDTGTGIPAEIVKRIFEPFFTTKPVGKGTGLGLTITYHNVRKHHGEISLISEPGKGSIFTVKLPIRQPEEDL